MVEGQMGQPCPVRIIVHRKVKVWKGWLGGARVEVSSCGTALYVCVGKLIVSGHFSDASTTLLNSAKMIEDEG